MPILAPKHLGFASEPLDFLCIRSVLPFESLVVDLKFSVPC